MIEYYEQLMNEEQQELTRIIKLLFRQTFLLEHKYEKRSGRFVASQDFRIADRHLEFLKAYFAVAGIQVCENSHMGLIYLQGETIVGEKLPRLASIYVLVLKLIYDEQMAAASSSVQVHTTLGEVNGRAGEFGLLKTTPSPTELRRTVTLLKRYQIVEPLDVMEDLGAESRLVIYPSIQAVLLGDDIRALLKLYSGSTEDSEETVDSREAEEEVAEDNDEDTADSSENDGKENSIGESEDDGREALYGAVSDLPEQLALYRQKSAVFPGRHQFFYRPFRQRKIHRH